VKKIKITKKTIETGKHRVNISFDISDFENLVYCADALAIAPGTLAQSWVSQRARSEAERLIKTNHIPKDLLTGNLFEKEKPKKGKGGKRV
jgi:hypothetical protein